MSLAKISNGTKLILGAGILLFIASLFDWNEACVGDICATGDSAWGYGVGPIFGILLIVTLAVVILLVLVEQNVVQMKLPELPIKNSVLVAGLTALTVIFGLIRFITHEDAGGIDIGRTFWAWAGLILMIAMAAGAFLRWQEGDAPQATPSM